MKPNYYFLASLNVLSKGAGVPVVKSGSSLYSALSGAFFFSFQVEARQCVSGSFKARLEGIFLSL